jgi:hypothetical protein
MVIINRFTDFERLSWDSERPEHTFLTASITELDEDKSYFGNFIFPGPVILP